MENKQRTLFYLSWLLAWLLQAYFTEITPDEAYYWMYSQQMAWGYFDHPPVIAAAIKIGDSLVHHELGVRLIPILMGTATLILWEKLIRPKKLLPFFLLVSSVGLLHFIGFFATPDAPLILSATLFLLAYKQLLKSSKPQTALALGAAMALMILSKYHALLIIGLCFMPNLKLVRNKHFWLSVLATTILISPHIAWQFHHDFPSIRYHLFERSAINYETAFTLDYLLGQLFMLGPITGFFFFWALSIERAKSDFERGLKFMFWGAYVFFFFMSFKGKVEGHWTFFAIIPGIYFTYRYISKNPPAYRWFSVGAIISLVLIFGVRVLVTKDFVGEQSISKSLSKRFHNQKEVALIQDQAQELPVAFTNSYQQASLYAFYTGNETFSLNNVMGRKNQFDIWNAEDYYRGKTVMLVPNYHVKKIALDTIKGTKATEYKTIDNFQSYTKVKLEASGLLEEIPLGDSLKISIAICSEDTVDIETNSDYPSYLYYILFQNGKDLYEVKTVHVTNEMINQEAQELWLQLPQEKGVFEICFALRTGWLPPTFNGKRYRLKIK